MKTKILTADAIKKFGSVKNLAAVLGITQEAVYQWKPYVPPNRIFELNHYFSEYTTKQRVALAEKAIAKREKAKK